MRSGAQASLATERALRAVFLSRDEWTGAEGVAAVAQYLQEIPCRSEGKVCRERGSIPFYSPRKYQRSER